MSTSFLSPSGADAGIPPPITEMPPSYTAFFLLAGVILLGLVLMYSKISFQQEATASPDEIVKTRVNALVPNHFLYSLIFIVGICVLWLGDFTVKESQAQGVLNSHVAGIEQVTDLTGPDALSLVASAVRGESKVVEVTVAQDGEIVPGRLKTQGNYVSLFVYDEETGKYGPPPAAWVA